MISGRLAPRQLLRNIRKLEPMGGGGEREGGEVCKGEGIEVLYQDNNFMIGATCLPNQQKSTPNPKSSEHAGNVRMPQLQPQALNPRPQALDPEPQPPIPSEQTCGCQDGRRARRDGRKTSLSGIPRIPNPLPYTADPVQTLDSLPKVEKISTTSRNTQRAQQRPGVVQATGVTRIR